MTAGQVRRWVRRRQRANSPGSDRFESLYTVALLIIMVGFAIWSQLHAILSGQSAGGPGARDGAALAIGLAWTAAVFAGCAALGPVSASGPALQWLFTAPLRRRPLLAPAALQALGLGLLAGFAQGLLTLTLSTVGARAVLVAAVAGGVLSVAVAMLLQAAIHRSAGWLSRIAIVLVVAGAAVGALSTTGFSVRGLAFTGPWGWPLAAAHHPWVAAAVGGLALIAPFFVVYRVEALTLANLNEAAQSSGAATAVFVTLDPGLASRAAEERRWRGRRLGPDRLPRWTGPLVATGQDLLLVSRSPVRLLLAAVLVTVPILATGLPVSRWAIGGVWLLAGLAAVAPSTANARRDRDEPGLARLLGLTDGQLFTGRVVVPVLCATAWSTVALLAVGAEAGTGGLGSWALLGACAGPGLGAGALRAARRKQVQHDFSPVVTPAGFLPTGPIMWLLGGVDVAVAALWPTLVAIASKHPQVGLANQVVFSVGTLTALVVFARRRKT